MSESENEPKIKTLLQYEIINPYKNFGEGDINSISDRQDGYWKTLIASQKIYVRFGLKSYCKVVSMEAKVVDVNLFQIFGYKDEKFLYDEMKLVSQKSREGLEIFKYELNNKNETVDEIELEISNFNKKPFALHFISFYGFVVREKNKKTQSKSFKKQVDEIKNKEKDHLNEEKKQIKETQNQKISDAIIESLAFTKFNTQGKSEKKVASQPDRKDQSKCSVKKGRNNEPLYLKSIIDESSLMEDLELKGLDEEVDYELLNVSKKDLGLFSNVTEEWLLMQKKFQFQANIRAEHQLSVLIFPDCFRDHIFCIANIYGSEKTKYAKLVKQMGGILQDEPSEGCFIVTTSMKGSLIGIAKLMRDVKFVSPKYMEDCHSCRSKLETKKYNLLEMEESE